MLFHIISMNMNIILHFSIQEIIDFYITAYEKLTIHIAININFHFQTAKRM